LSNQDSNDYKTAKVSRFCHSDTDFSDTLG
jgi:hypothetical protein